MQIRRAKSEHGKALSGPRQGAQPIDHLSHLVLSSLARPAHRGGGLLLSLPLPPALCEQVSGTSLAVGFAVGYTDSQALAPPRQQGLP